MQTKTEKTINLSDLFRSLKTTIASDIKEEQKYLRENEKELEEAQEGKQRLKAAIKLNEKNISRLTEIEQNISSLQSEALIKRTPESVRERLSELGDRLKPEEARKLEKLLNSKIKTENNKSKLEIGKQIKAIERLANKLDMGDRIITIKDRLGQPIGLSRSFKEILEMITDLMNSKIRRELLYIGEGRTNDHNTLNIDETGKIIEILSITRASLDRINGIDVREAQEYLRTLESNYIRQNEQTEKKPAQEAKKRQTEQFKKSQIKKSQSRIEQNKAKKSTDSELVTMEDMKNSYKETSAVEKKGLFGRIRAERNRKNQMDKESEKTNE